MQFKFSFIFVTLVLMPFKGIATEVISFQDANNTATHIRTLAASCAACHGTWGNAASVQGITYKLPLLAGLNTDYFVAQMLAFKAGQRSPLIMQRHAKGLTIAEINALGIYFFNQKPVLQKPLKSQSFKNNHAQ